MFRSLFSRSTRSKLAHILAGRPLIIDVRTPEEFHQGHVTGSVNIPLEKLRDEMKNLDKRQPIVTCCRSGIRSASAAALLTSNGFMASNGGTWQSVERQMPAS